MNLDVDQLMEEDVDIKNEMHSIFKKLHEGYKDILSVYEKFEKPIISISENLKEYARESSVSQQESPFFELAKKYESLIDAQKQLVHDVTDDVVLVMQQLVNKSELLNDTIKDLSSNAKKARNLKKKIEKIDNDIEEANAKGKPDKIAKKETEKTAKEAEFKLAKDKLSDSKGRFDNVFADFNSERDELLKGALEKMAVAEKTYISILNDIIGAEEDTASKL